MNSTRPTTEEARRLWTAKEHGSEPARREIIERYRYLVPITVKRAVPVVPYRISAEDLISEANIGLIRAVDEFEPERGVRFTSYAVMRMRNRLLEYLRSQDWVSRGARQRQKAYEAALMRGEADLTPPVIIEVISLSALLHEEDREEPDGSGPRVETVVSAAGAGHDLPLIGAEQAACLRAAVAYLPPADRALLHAVYWRGQTMADLARQQHCSESRLHQHHQVALHQLRSLLRASPLF